MQKGLVEKVVGRTFDSSVLESPQNVFLEVYDLLALFFIKVLSSHFKCTIVFLSK